MSYRRRHRWLRRVALGLALVSAFSAGRVAVAAARIDEGAPARAQAAPVRPDDRRSRFAQPVEAFPARGWTLERSEALLIVIGSASLVLGLGLALGYVRRPRLAGH